MPSIKYFYKKIILRKIFTLLDFLGRPLAYFFRRSINQSAVKKILLVNPSGIGDVVLTEPLIRQIKLLWPAAALDLVVDQPAQTILNGHPALRKIEVFSLPWLSHSQPSWRAALVGSWQQLQRWRQEKYDLAFDVKGDPIIILMMLISGVKYRCGFINGGLGWLLTAGYDFFSQEIYRAHLNFQLLSAWLPDWRALPARPQLALSAEEELAAKKLLSVKTDPDRQTIAIHLGGGQPEKIWPPAYWQKLFTLLSEVNLVIIGEKRDNKLLRQIDNGRLINLLDLELRLTSAIIKQSDLFVGGDSGPGHLAAAVGTPVVSIFSAANNYKIWGADGADIITEEPDCRHCQASCRSVACLQSISAERVYQVVKKHLTKPSTA